MSAVIVVHLIKIQTMLRSKVRPFRANKAPEVNKTKGLKRKINVRKEESFFLLLHVKPSVGDYIVTHAPGFLVVNMGQRREDNMNIEPQWWISSSCPSLS